MKKSHIIYGADYSSKNSDYNAEVLMQLHPDGTQEILEIYRWKTSIDLGKDAYRVRSATAPAQ